MATTTPRAPTVEFTMDFAVDAEDGEEAYKALIENIRAELARGDGIEGVPILAPQVPAGGSPRFFDVNLSYTDRTTTFTVQARFRTDNLYLVRYRPANSNEWEDLEKNNDENYNSLETVAGMRLENIPLSASHIGAAITTLGGGMTDVGQRKRAVLTLIFAIAEAARFRNISDLIYRSWWSASTPGIHLANQVRSWGRLSTAVQRTRNEGHRFDFDGDNTQIWSFIEAIRALGIMLLAPATCTPGRPTRDLVGAFRSTCAQGQPLLEIFHVRINSIDGESPGQLYGSITATDSARSRRIWGREQHDYVEIGPGDDILLEGPSGPLSAADELYIQMDLWDYDSLPSDDSIAKGTIAFNPRGSFAVYDAITNREVTGPDGSVTVSYVAISDGLYAQIIVILTNGDGEDPAEVYGEITAENSHGKSMLFDKKKSQHIDVKPQEKIPLLRSVVAVPVTGILHVHASLWDHDIASGDDEIAHGAVKFQPSYGRSEKTVITGKSGKVEVRVTWM